MKHYLFSLLCCFVLSAAALEITPDHTIVTGETLSVTETKANDVLFRYLSEIFGKQPRRTTEKQFDGKGKAIYLGNTA